jgi:hypothetical protein
VAQRFAPKRNTRGTFGSSFFELSLAPGPDQIGVTGDNRYETLYGRAWLLVWDDTDNFLKLYQEVSDGVWTRATVNLPGLFNAEMPAGARHVVFAFDQSARIIVVYEQNDQILVTRWDATTSQYVQNVTFAGHDPVLLIDASVVDPRGYPNAADDGWSVREAYYAGIRVFFLWVPPSGAGWRDNAITDSDIVLFYLSADRTTVRARVQRELYNTVRTIHTYAEPVVLDRAVALPQRYQLLVSNAAGDKLDNMLVSAFYATDFYINPEPTEVATGAIQSLPTWNHAQLLLVYPAIEDALAAVQSIPAWSHVAILMAYPNTESGEAFVVSLPAWSHVANLLDYDVSEDAEAAVESLPAWLHVASTLDYDVTESALAAIESLPDWRLQGV